MAPDPRLGRRYRVKPSRLRWSCPASWIQPTAPLPSGAPLLWGQARLRAGLEAAAKVHGPGGGQHVEVTTSRTLGWAPAVAGCLRELLAERVPVLQLAAPHVAELRGSGDEAGLLAGANGGVVVLDAAGLSRDVWQACLESILRGTCRGQDGEGVPAGPERAARISLVLVGTDPELRGLRERHPEFVRIFSTRLFADPDIARDRAGASVVAARLRAGPRGEGASPLGQAALRWLVEEASGSRARRKRLTLDLAPLHQAVAEAGAGARGRLSRTAVQERLEALRSRHDTAEGYARSRLDEQLLALDTKGSAVGLVNGLMIYGSSRQGYCMPGRISARVSAGREGIINIERESKYSGSSFDKGVFQLSAWLRGLFGHSAPLGFAATLVFEQSSGKVDGDSATLAESLALLSALSGQPSSQGIAVSGSINQRGDVLPVGSVNLKVEGWWKSCQQSGVTGEQGVLIPTRNIGDLHLSEEVVRDISAGRFHLWAVKTIEEAVAVVLGQSAGKRLKSGRFTSGSVFDRAERRLSRLSESIYPRRKSKASAPARKKKEG